MSRIADILVGRDFRAFLMRVFQTLNPGEHFIWNWHIDSLASALMDVIEGRGNRLIITLPPRCLKSIVVSVALPAWILGHNRCARLIVVSYAQDLSAKFSVDFRRVLESDWYRRLFPKTRIDKNSEREITTTAGGSRLATSVEGVLTGRGADIIICDDILKPQDAMSDARRSATNEWARSTLFSRLNDPANGKIIVVAQRLHVDDLIGNLLGSSHWDHLNLPAIADCDREIPIGHGRVHRFADGELLDSRRLPRHVLDDLRQQLGTAHFSAQYLQTPIPVEGNLVHWQWLQFFDQAPPRPRYEVYQSWDVAQRTSEQNDYSVCTTWFVVDERFYLVDLVRFRALYPDLRKKALEQAQAWRPNTIIVEDAGVGTALAEELNRSGFSARAFRPDKDKVSRLSAQSAKIECGRVLLPRDANWLPDLKAELLAFPMSRHDDMVDSISQMLTWWDEKPGWARIRRV
ncbi:MAG: phage terminase large subunit [Hyphomicrobiales bacterium]